MFRNVQHSDFDVAIGGIVAWSTGLATEEAELKSYSHVTDRARRLRKLLVTLALGVGVIGGLLVAPGTAAAIPPGGYCYNNWYVFGTLYGEIHKPYGTVRRMTNSSTDPVTWTESITVSTTFTSTYTTTTTFTGGLNLGIISLGISRSTSRTITQTISVSQTSTSSTVVNPGQTKYMAYGTFGLSTSGTYNQQMYWCNGGYAYPVKSGTVNGYSLTSVGWRVWT